MHVTKSVHAASVHGLHAAERSGGGAVRGLQRSALRSVARVSVEAAVFWLNVDGTVILGGLFFSFVRDRLVTAAACLFDAKGTVRRAGFQSTRIFFFKQVIVDRSHRVSPQ